MATLTYVYAESTVVVGPLSSDRIPGAFDLCFPSDYIVERMKAEMNEPNTQVVATGGLSRLIATRTQAIDHLDGLLTLKGLRIIYEKNRG